MNSFKDFIVSKIPKPRIRDNFLLLKSKINNYLNSGKVVAINDIEKQLLKHSLISANFNEYINNKINNKNMIYSVVVCVISLFMVLRLLLGSFVRDPNIWILIGDPFYLVGDRVLINISLVIFVTVGIKARIVYISRKFFFIKIVLKFK
jgi:hypothetical protein